MLMKKVIGTIGIFCSITIFAYLIFGWTLAAAPTTNWNESYNSSGTQDNKVRTMAIDSSGNVISGGETEATDTDWTIIKRDGTNGSILWGPKTYDSGSGDDWLLDITTDSTGDVIATGGNASGDFYTIKYDGTTGNVETGWPKTYDSGNADGAMAAITDSSNNVYVFGLSNDGTDNKFRVIKYNSGGTQQWNQVYNQSDGYNYDTSPADDLDSSPYYEAGSIDVDSNDDIAITGTYDNNGNDWITIKINKTTGAELWEKTINTSGTNNDKAYLLEFTSDDDLYVAGYSYIDATNTEDWRVILYNGSDGAVETGWTPLGKTYGNTTADEWPLEIAVDSSKNIVLVGQGNTQVVKYNSSGTPVWTINPASMQGTTTTAINASGDIIVSGSSSSNGWLTYLYNSSHNEIWNASYLAASGTDIPTESGFGASVVVSGYSTGTSTGTDFRDISYSESGASQIPELPSNIIWKVVIALLSLGLVVGVAAFIKKKKK